MHMAIHPIMADFLHIDWYLRPVERLEAILKSTLCPQKGQFQRPIGILALLQPNVGPRASPLAL